MLSEWFRRDMSARHNERNHELSADYPEGKTWLCVMCKTQQESIARDNLTRQGFTVYLPMAQQRGRKQGRVTTNSKAMFPGYLFIEADLEYQDLSVIRSTIGCIAFLRRGGQPALVPNQVLASIKEAEDVLYGRFEINQGFTPGNKYELMVILGKRARQIAAQEKLELDEKLQYFEGFEDDDEFSFNEEQEQISKAFEKLPHATRRAIIEMEDDAIYYRRPEVD